MDLAKEVDETVKDGVIGFNQYIIIKTDFDTVDVENLRRDQNQSD